MGWGRNRICGARRTLRAGPRLRRLRALQTSAGLGSVMVDEVAAVHVVSGHDVGPHEVIVLNRLKWLRHEMELREQECKIVGGPGPGGLG